MLLTKQQLKAYLFTGDDETRPAIGHVKVEPTGRVLAANGHVAVIVEPIGQMKIAEVESPVIPGLDGADPTQPIYLPADVAHAAEKLAPSNPDSVGNRARLLLDKHITIGVTDGHAPQLVLVEPPAVENFPDIDAIVPTKPAKSVITLDAEYVELIAKYAQAFRLGRSSPITLYVYGPTEPMRVEWTDEYHRVTAVVMPVAKKDTTTEPEERPKGVSR
jgi:hypothetical protein